MPNNEGFDKNGNTQIDSIGKMLDSVKELRKLVDKDGKKSSIYFRGQEWKDKEDKDLQLLPAIGRKQKFCGEELEFDLESEVNLLHRFRRWAYLELKRPIGEWEALFLARHHRLPVRLLDWTSNPLFALYFASECEKPQGDAAVWVIVKDDKVEDIDVLKEEWEHNTGKIDNNYYQCWHELPDDMKVRYKKYKKEGFNNLPKPIRLKGLRILYPFYASPRMNAQQSFFTIQDNPWKPLEKYGELRESEKGKSSKNRPIQIQRLLRRKVPGGERQSIIKELVRLGIHNQILYPDLDGLAKGLWQIEVVRSWK